MYLFIGLVWVAVDFKRLKRVCKDIHESGDGEGLSYGGVVTAGIFIVMFIFPFVIADDIVKSFKRK